MCKHFTEGSDNLKLPPSKSPTNLLGEGTKFTVLAVFLTLLSFYDFFARALLSTIGLYWKISNMNDDYVGNEIEALSFGE